MKEERSDGGCERNPYQILPQPWQGDEGSSSYPPFRTASLSQAKLMGASIHRAEDRWPPTTRRQMQSVPPMRIYF